MDLDRTFELAAFCKVFVVVGLQHDVSNLGFLARGGSTNSSPESQDAIVGKMSLHLLILDAIVGKVSPKLSGGSRDEPGGPVSNSIN